MNIARAAESAALSWVVFGLLVAYGVSALTFGCYRYLRYSWRLGPVAAMMVCVVALVVVQMWHMQNLYESPAGWLSEQLERYSLAVQMQAVGSVFIASILVGLTVSFAATRMASRLTAVWVLVGLACLSLAVAMELLDFASQLTDANPGGSPWLPIAWMLTIMAVVAGAVAYLARPGERARYPWWWYAFWMGAASPLGVDSHHVLAELEEWRRQNGSRPSDA